MLSSEHVSSIALDVLVLVKATFVDVLVCQTNAAQLQHESPIACAADHVLAADMGHFYRMLQVQSTLMTSRNSPYADC